MVTIEVNHRTCWCNVKEHYCELLGFGNSIMWDKEHIGVMQKLCYKRHGLSTSMGGGVFLLVNQ